MTGKKSDFSRRLLAWYERHRRDLPWRIKPGSRDRLNPYHVLVSEAMLQQTQVATVIPYFDRFLKRFPTLQSLAEADEQDVLRLWQGLGYYSRARNLQKAAKKITSDLGSMFPQSAEALLALPGVGRYTAGAIASIAFDQKTPIVDGNVARVICRLDKIETDPRDKPTQELLWRRAEEILPNRRCGDFNSSLMELGATICTPRNPQCLLCPVREHCEALAAGKQEQIPAPRKAKPTPLLRRDVLCIRKGSQYLIEQRPAKGRWAGMWQFVTIEAGKPVTLSSRAQIALGFPVDPTEQIGTVAHTLTHRRYEFVVHHAKANSAANGGGRTWATLDALDQYPLPRPHVKIMEMVIALSTRDHEKQRPKKKTGLR